MYNHPLRRHLPGSKLGRADWRSEDRPIPDSSLWSRNYNVRTPYTPQASFVPSPLATPYAVQRSCSGVETPEEVEEVISIPSEFDAIHLPRSWIGQLALPELTLPALIPDPGSLSPDLVPPPSSPSDYLDSDDRAYTLTFPPDDGDNEWSTESESSFEIQPLRRLSSDVRRRMYLIERRRE